jgi:hypothetical protein
MKKIIIILLLALVAALAAIGYFVLNFDANQYRSFVMAKIQEATGYPVELKSVQLQWRGGIALRLEGLSVYPKKDSRVPSVKVDEASANLELLPLLQQKINIGSVTLARPTVSLIRGQNGMVRLMGIPPTEVPVKVGEKTSGGTGGLMALPLLISEVKIQGGNFYYADEGFEPPMNISVESADVSLKDISLTNPISVSASFALMGGEQNMKMKGRVRLPVVSSKAEIRDFHLETDLGRVDLKTLGRLYPELRRWGVNKDLKGTVVFDADRLTVPLTPADPLDIAVEVKSGRVKLQDLSEALDDINAKAAVMDQKINVKEASFQMAGGRIELQTEIEQYSTLPSISLDARWADISLERAIPEIPGNAVRLTGILGGTFAAKTRGLKMPDIANAANGQGKVTVRGPVIKNMNVLKEVFDRMSMIPGLVERLMKNLSPEYQKQLTETDTPLQDIAQDIVIQNGTVVLRNVSAATKNFAVTGIAQVTADGFLTAQMMLTIDPQLSEAFMRRVAELQYLADKNGSIQIPLKIQGPLGKPTIMPDLQYVASKLAVNKAAELIGGLFEKKQNKNQVPQSSSTGQGNAPVQQEAPTTSTPQKKTSPEAEILNTVLGSLFGSDSSQQKSSAADNPPR